MKKSFQVEAWRPAGFLPTCCINWTRTIAVLLALVAASIQLPAQTSLGTILGNITDESGAAVPRVAVTITNEATSAPRTVTTSEAGSYTVPALPAGSYKI